MKYLKALLVYSVIIAGVVCEGVYGMSGLGNISMFASWVLIGLIFLCSLVDGKVLSDAGATGTNLLGDCLLVICVIVQLYFGWHVTAVFLFSSWILIKAKITSYKSKIEANSDV